MLPADGYSHVALAEEGLVAESSANRASSELDADHLEQRSASGFSFTQVRRRFVLVPLAVVALLGFVALLSVGVHQRSSKPAQSSHVTADSALEEWTFIPRLQMPKLPNMPQGLKMPKFNGIPGVNFTNITERIEDEFGKMQPGESMSCSADIIVQSELGSVRVPSAAYAAGTPVALFSKVAPLAVVSCPTLYSVVCDMGSVKLHVKYVCKKPPAQLSAVEKVSVQNDFKRLVGRAASIPKEIVAGSRDTISFSSHELPDLTSSAVQIFATTQTCYALPEGACRQGCCKQGFQCAFQNKPPVAWRKHEDSVYEPATPVFQEFLGVCVPTRWTPAQVCVNEADPQCQSLVADVTNTSSSWQLIITSGGGGGHHAAATSLATLAKEDWEAALATTGARLNLGNSLLTAFGQAALARTLQSAKDQRPPIEVVDIMKSPCTNLLGAAGIPWGGFLKKTWDSAQQAGDIASLKIFVHSQFVVDDMFYKQCLTYMRKVLKGELGQNRQLPHVGPPSRLIDTEPMLIPSISEAVNEGMNQGSTLTKVHLYMTDLPGEGKYKPFSFWDPIKAIQAKHAEASRCLVLHTVAPLTGGAAAIASKTGLAVSQVAIERFLPVNPGFYEGGMPKPRTATEITLMAQLPEEEAFLGGVSRTFSIGATDTVMLVMLGSQPTVKAIHAYLEQAALLRQPPPGTMQYVFLASGPHQKPAYRDLYVSLSTRAAALNKEQEASGSRLRFIPFTGQPAQPIEGRAEVTVTRSGGMTAGELLALDARGDNKQAFLHIEEAAGIPPKPPCCDLTVETEWEAKALGLGMVPWEAGNARYLIRKIGAKLITPQTFASMVKPQTSV